MPSRHELNLRARVLGLDPSTIVNDSKLEQKVLWLEKNATAFTGAVGTGTLTSDATPQTSGDQVKIGDITYTFVDNLTGVKATGLLTSDATAPSDGDTVTIDGRTYTFKATLSSPAQQNEVAIGISAAVALDNLKLAINQGSTTWPTAADSSGEGTTWSTGTVRHHSVTAETNTNTTQVVQAYRIGTYANGFFLGENSTHLAWGDPAMGTVVTSEVAGVDDVPYEVLLGANVIAMLDNLKLAINAGANTGEYSPSTPAHPQVTATTNSNTQQVIETLDTSITNAAIATTDPVDTGNHMAWGAGTLASGVAKVVAVADGTTVGVRTTNAGISGDKNVQED